MDKPTATDFTNWTNLRLPRFGYSDVARLQPILDRATGYIVYMTGQKLDALDPSLNPGMTAADLEPLVQQAIQMRAEQVILQSQQGHAVSAADNEVVSGFTAGPYSEQRRDPQRKGEQRSINTWPALDELLWMLMTPERFAFWWAYVTGQPIADTWVEEVDWRALGTVITFFEPWDRYVPAGAY